MSWAKLLASNIVAALPATKAEIDNLRTIVTRSLSDVAVVGLSVDSRFIMAYDAARTLSLGCRRTSTAVASSAMRPNMPSPVV